MTYHRLEIKLQNETADLATALLWELGTLGIEVNDRDRTGSSCLIAYFEERADIDSIVLRLQALDATAVTGCTKIRRGDWPEAWKSYFTTFNLGKHFTVMPPWELDTQALPPGRIRLAIEPGSAFGTGRHATTALCLERIEAAMPESRDCLDLGTGSGILAIAAMKLGARSVIAVDKNREVCENFQKNLEMNGLTGKVPLIVGTQHALSGLQADIIFANIELNTLMAAADTLSLLIKRRNGRMILSGFLDEDIPCILDAFGRRSRRDWVSVSRDGWGAIDMRFPGRKT
ncbi:50S ribosomal protein L11 methyltransferase [Acidobacteriota bacterium]